MILDKIDYNRISKAQIFYKALGYKNIEVPWIVSKEAVNATLPPDHKMFSISWGNSISSVGALVGSGEQSFIELMIRNLMKPGKYQTTTPCFRDEKEYNELTRVAFFKTELIWYKPEDTRAAFEMVLNNALACFFEISDVETFEAVETAEGYDIYCDGVELGSYGVREMKEYGHVWVYGTGLAEPRFSILMRRIAKAHKVSSVSDSNSGVEANG